MAASLYWKAEGRKALRYNVNILNLWPPTAQWSCHNERRAPFWLYLPVILTLPPSMQAAEAFGLADTEAACTRDGHMKMPTTLQAPHSETHNSPALVCFFFNSFQESDPLHHSYWHCVFSSQPWWLGTMCMRQSCSSSSTRTCCPKPWPVTWGTLIC